MFSLQWLLLMHIHLCTAEQGWYINLTINTPHARQNTPHGLTKCSHEIDLSKRNCNRGLLQSRATQLDITTQSFSPKTRHNDISRQALSGRIKYEPVFGEDLGVRWPGTELHVAEHPLYDWSRWYGAGVRNVDITSSWYSLVPSGRYSDLRLYMNKENYGVCELRTFEWWATFSTLNHKSTNELPPCG